MKNEPMTRWQAYFPADLLAEVDAWASKNGIRNRADAIRHLLRRALDAEKDNTKGRRLTVAEREELDKLLAVTGADDYPSAIRQARRSVRDINEDKV
jgi:Arc/MetJ-type ribon-helix-helix transcriptional regulator